MCGSSDSKALKKYLWACIQQEQIERIEAERPAPPHEFVEHRPAVGPGTYNLAVQDGGPAGEFLADKFKEGIPVQVYEGVSYAPGSTSAFFSVSDDVV